MGGDTAAWAELLVRHRPLIMAIARRNGLTGEAAEDLYQSTCLTMLERLDLLRDHRSLAAWVATTAARKAWKARADRRDVPLVELASQAPSPEREFADAAEQAAVRDALSRMKEPCRTLLRRMFVDDVPYQSLAKELGLAVGSIGVYRRRCLDRLRKDLHASGWRGPAALPDGADSKEGIGD